MPYKVLVVASNIPETGLTTRPVIPLRLPLKNPPIPLSCAPSIGEVKTPVTPLENPLAILFTPLAKPSPI
jgi:hypothetical protein